MAGILSSFPEKQKSFKEQEIRHLVAEWNDKLRSLF